MFSNRPGRAASSFGFGMTRGPVAPDLIVLLAVLFVTFSLQFFKGVRLIPELLRLTSQVWQFGFLWQIATYPFVGQGAPNIWFLLELFILLLFARDVFSRLGRRSFWRLVAWGSLTAGLVAVGIQVLGALPDLANPAPIVILQGQRMLLVIVIAAFATLYQSATIYLFFVLPIRARWFLWIEILFAFMGFLGTGDLAGFLGITAAVGMVYNILSGGNLRRTGRELWLRFEQQRMRMKLARMRRKRGMRIVKDESDDPPERRDPWVH